MILIIKSFDDSLHALKANLNVLSVSSEGQFQGRFHVNSGVALGVVVLFWYAKKTI